MPPIPLSFLTIPVGVIISIALFVFKTKTNRNQNVHTAKKIKFDPVDDKPMPSKESAVMKKCEKCTMCSKDLSDDIVELSPCEPGKESALRKICDNCRHLIFGTDKSDDIFELSPCGSSKESEVMKNCEICTICQRILRENVVELSPCEHKYHKGCIDFLWNSEPGFCKTCRQHGRTYKMNLANPDSWFLSLDNNDGTSSDDKNEGSTFVENSEVKQDFDNEVIKPCTVPDDEDNICSLCNLNIVDGKGCITYKKCNHKFHDSCAKAGSDIMYNCFIKCNYCMELLAVLMNRNIENGLRCYECKQALKGTSLNVSCNHNLHNDCIVKLSKIQLCESCMMVSENDNILMYFQSFLQNDNCAFCLNKSDDEEMNKIFSCGHAFHLSCHQNSSTSTSCICTSKSFDEMENKPLDRKDKLKFLNDIFHLHRSDINLIKWIKNLNKEFLKKGLSIRSLEINNINEMLDK